MFDKDGDFVMGATIRFVPPVSRNSSISAVEHAVSVPQPLLGRRVWSYINQDVCFQRSNYSISFNNKSSATFNLFHQAKGVESRTRLRGLPRSSLQEGRPASRGTLRPDKSPRTPPPDTCTTASRVVFGSDPPPRVWGVQQLTGYTPTGGLPKTVFQYAAGVLKAVLPAGEDIGPNFWIDAGKDWRDSYSFIIPLARSRETSRSPSQTILLTVRVMVTIEDWN
ncbi:hypothetical protein B0H14DRAFT_3884510 [Mycena olivaceomarginata]|nr:hypothetical protein B0H14DRAFT_3884510 [Mycena olivaceomarginata]